MLQAVYPVFVPRFPMFRFLSWLVMGVVSLVRKTPPAEKPKVVRKDEVQWFCATLVRVVQEMLCGERAEDVDGGSAIRVHVGDVTYLRVMVEDGSVSSTYWGIMCRPTALMPVELEDVISLEDWCEFCKMVYRFGTPSNTDPRYFRVFLSWDGNTGEERLYPQGWKVA
jgi:hypothetical protein